MRRRAPASPESWPVGTSGSANPGSSNQLHAPLLRTGSKRWRTVVVEADGILVGAIDVRGEIRSETPAVIDALHKLELTVAMLTGDNAGTAKAIGVASGIDEIHAGLLPSDKAAVIEQLIVRGVVDVVGDGSTTHQHSPEPT